MMTRKKLTPIFKCDKPIVLMGMMGVGKTTVGRRLAPKVGLPFFDADEQIELAAGMPVTDLFECHGETYFRKGEHQVIRRLINGPTSVIATGGGAILNEDTLHLIKEKALSVWLRTPIDVILQRVSQRPTRPLLKQGDPLEIITRLLEERSPFYAQADCILDTPQGPHSQTVNALIETLQDYMNPPCETNNKL